MYTFIKYDFRITLIHEKEPLKPTHQILQLQSRKKLESHQYRETIYYPPCSKGRGMGPFVPRDFQLSSEEYTELILEELPNGLTHLDAFNIVSIFLQTISYLICHHHTSPTECEKLHRLVQDLLIKVLIRKRHVSICCPCAPNSQERLGVKNMHRLSCH